MLCAMRQRAGPTNLKTKHANQAAIADEGHNADPEVDDLTFRELLAQFIEQCAVRGLMIAC